MKQTVGKKEGDVTWNLAHICQRRKDVYGSYTNIMLTALIHIERIARHHFPFCPSSINNFPCQHSWSVSVSVAVFSAAASILILTLIAQFSSLAWMVIQKLMPKLNFLQPHISKEVPLLKLSYCMTFYHRSPRPPSL